LLSKSSDIHDLFVLIIFWKIFENSFSGVMDFLSHFEHMKKNIMSQFFRKKYNITNFLEKKI